MRPKPVDIWFTIWRIGFDMRNNLNNVITTFLPVRAENLICVWGMRYIDDAVAKWVAAVG